MTPPYIDPLREQIFRAMVQDYARSNRTSPDPDAFQQHYQYRDWYDAMLSDPTQAPQIDPVDGIWHLPADYKTMDSPERYVDTSEGTWDTVTNNINPGPRLSGYKYR